MPEGHHEGGQSKSLGGEHNGVAAHTTNYSSESKEVVPVLIQKDNIRHPNYYVVVGNDYPEKNHILTQYERIDIIEDANKSAKKMDYLTQFYIGSITVVGLFVFYRLLNKTK